MATKPRRSIPAKASPVVALFGLTKDREPQGGRYSGRLADLAVKAAAAMGLSVITPSTPAANTIVSRLPRGRIQSNGRAIIARIKRDLYQALTTLAHDDRGQPRPASLSAAATPPQRLNKNEAGTAGNPAGTDGLPKSWADIGPGQLVLVQESLHDGWWEAVVVDRRDDMLTVRWRDYSKYKPFTIHVDAVARVNPEPSFNA